MNAHTQITAEARRAKDTAAMDTAIAKLTKARAAIATRDSSWRRYKFYAERMAEFVDALTHVLPDCDELPEEMNMWLEEAEMFTEDNWPEDVFGNRASEDGLYIPLAERSFVKREAA